MDLSYRKLHWGESSTGDERLIIASGEPATFQKGRGGFVEILACSYTTRKRGEPETVYRHAFERHQGRRARLLVNIGQPRARHADEPQRTVFVHKGARMIALGRLLDLELSDGRKVATPFHWIVTAENPAYQGGPVVIASRFGPSIAIEHRVIRNRLYPYITEHGIMG